MIPLPIEAEYLRIPQQLLAKIHHERSKIIWTYKNSDFDRLKKNIQNLKKKKSLKNNRER